MANRKNNAPLGTILVIFVIFATVAFGLVCIGAFNAADDADRCRADGGYYEVDGGCDFPNR